MEQLYSEPVLWSTQGAKDRLTAWLTAQGYIIFPTTKTASYYCYEESEVTIPHAPFTLSEFNNAVKDSIKKYGSTKESFLHMLNIVLPLGQFEYSYDYIQKIVEGCKNMSLRKTQYPCGYYQLFCTLRKEVREIIEICRVDKVVMDPYFFEHSYWVQHMYKNCGFNTPKEFIDYHRKNYHAVKYLHTFSIVQFSE